MHQRSPLVDGILYPGSAETLSTLISSTLGRSQPQPEGSLSCWPKVILTPHGGYHHIAPLMGEAFTHVRESNPRRIVILAPLHREPLKGHSDIPVFFPSEESFVVPNGEVPIDRDAIDGLCSLTTLTASSDRHTAPIVFNGYFDEEPAIEVQLPYIVHLFPQVPIIPGLVGSRRSSTAHAVARLLNGLLEEGTLIIVTTNLSDHLPCDTAQEHAQRACDILTGADMTPLMEAYRSRLISMCGVHILAGLNRYLSGKGYRFELLNRSHSSISARNITHHAAGIFPVTIGASHDDH